jgi:aminoglycoside phosphotransferase (APT) family kinase protein
VSAPHEGRILASGRASEVILLDEGRVLRRIHGRADHEREAALMRHAAGLGYPVPAVLEVRPDGLVLERVKGPTMAHDLLRRPWRLRRHARTLADLHRRLHRLAPPPEAPARHGPPGPDDVFIHGDLHPLNVLLSPVGPVVIDWTNAGRGPGGLDVADTWLVLAAARIDGPWAVRALGAMLRRGFLREFLAVSDRQEAARQLEQAAAWRSRDPHLRAEERSAMLQLAARYGGGWAASGAGLSRGSGRRCGRD